MCNRRVKNCLKIPNHLGKNVRKLQGHFLTHTVRIILLCYSVYWCLYVCVCVRDTRCLIYINDDKTNMDLGSVVNPIKY